MVRRPADSSSRQLWHNPLKTPRRCSAVHPPPPVENITVDATGWHAIKRRTMCEEPLLYSGRYCRYRVSACVKASSGRVGGIYVASITWLKDDVGWRLPGCALERRVHPCTAARRAHTNGRSKWRRKLAFFGASLDSSAREAQRREMVAHSARRRR